MRDITKQEFDAYEEVRLSGATNMFAVNYVCQLSGLEREEVIDIMKNYAKYKKEFLSARK